MMVLTTPASTKQPDITECSSCSKVFTDPRMLPCTHTYCLKCIETSTKDKHPGDKVPCPFCGRKFTLTKNGPRDLPKNFFVAKLLQIRELRQTDGKSTSCDVCRYGESDTAMTKPPTMYCPDCQEQLCEDCVACHRRMRATRSHKLITLDNEITDDVYAKYRTVYCDKHPDDSLRIYCFDCKRVVCMMCYVEEHNSHKFAEVGKVEEQFRGQVENDVVRLATGLKKSQNVLRKLTKENDRFSEQVGKAEKEIWQKAEQLKQMIERHKQKLLSELTSAKQGRFNELGRISEDLERKVRTMESLMCYGGEVMSKGIACDIAGVAGNLHELAEELLQSDAVDRCSLANLGHVDVTFTLSNYVVDDVTRTLGETTVTVREKAVKLSTATLTHMVLESNGVCAITSLNDDVFVAYYNVKQVEVHSAGTLLLKHCIFIPDLGPYPFGLAACERYSCLYVSDCNQNVVHRVELAENNPQMNWSVYGGPRGLSVNAAHNLIVTCTGTNMLLEYTTQGSLLREIWLQQTAVGTPWHSVQLSGGQFLVSHETPVRNVSVVGVDGRVLQSYTESVESAVGPMDDPRSLVVDRNGCILVADENNSRVLVINPSMTSAQVLPLTVDGGLRRPRGLCLDESRGRLYVGEWSGRRLLVFDNVKLVA